MKIKGMFTILPVMLGALLFIRVPLVGELRALELFALMCLPFTLGMLFKFDLKLKIIYLVILFIVFSQVIVDLLLDVTVFRTVKFVAVYLFPIISLLLLLRFIKTEKDFLGFCIGAFFSALVFTKVDEVQSIFSENTNYFKQRYLSALIFFVPVYYYLINHKKLIPGVVSILELSLVAVVLYLMLLMDVRSFGLIFVLSYILSKLYVKLNYLIRVNGYILSTLMLTLSYSGYLVYIFSVEYFELGGINAKSQLDQVGNILNPLELLSLGRSSVYETFKLASANWLIGFGSYQGPHSLQWDLTTHSVIAGNFLYGGLLLFVLGMILAGTILLFAIQSIFLNKNSRIRVFLISYFTLLFLWDYLFSPFGYLRLALPPLLLYLMLVQIEKKDSIYLSS